MLNCTLCCHCYRDRQRDGATDETNKLIQDVIETIDLAKTQKIVLSQLEDKLQDAYAQVGSGCLCTGKVQGWGQFHLINSNSLQFNQFKLNSFCLN